jgi:hypothetical protein
MEDKIMKLKSKILIAVFAVFFLAAGNAVAIPIVDYSISGNEVTFNVTNDLTGYDIYEVGFGAAGLTLQNTNDTWVLPGGVQYAGSNGKHWFYVDPYTDNASGIQITFIDGLPAAIVYTIYILGEDPYQGAGATYVGIKNGLYEYKFGGRFDTTSVPEPASLIFLGLGLLGIAGFRKKLHK